MSAKEFTRSAGVLLHITSLHNAYGVGDFGGSAFRFADFLKEAGQSFWQVLPLGPIGFGNSPYSSCSSFALNPLFLDLEGLAKWLGFEIPEIPTFPSGLVDYPEVSKWKMETLENMTELFWKKSSIFKEELDQFKKDNNYWLPDYAFFMALKDFHGGRSWDLWRKALARREPQILKKWKNKLEERINFHIFVQFALYRQWQKLKDYVNSLGICLIGDLPIYVAYDSVEVWTQPEYFLLDQNLRPLAKAGVPPDVFSPSGQLWGNPIYNWERMKKDCFSWWVKRFRHLFRLVDVVRIDHFRGFEAYWEVPAHARTAKRGQWVKAPGEALFAIIKEELNDPPLIAENLGFITPEVEALRKRFSFLGMKILQYGLADRSSQEHLFPNEDDVAFTGTHDNDTILGWFSKLPVSKKRKVLAILRSDGERVHLDVIKFLYRSKALLAMVPVQDILGLPSSARMNTPSTGSGNWEWRLDSFEQLLPLASFLADLAEKDERI